MTLRTLPLSLLLAPLWAGKTFAQSQEDETDAHGYDKMRIEQEDKLLVPADQVEEVWEYLRQRLIEDQEFLRSLDPGFTSKWSEELFHDTYYDTPSMQLYDMQSGVRHRWRKNLSNPDDAKSGRQLMQIKLNDISSNELERGEIKYDIEYQTQPKSDEDRHPMLGIVKPEHREPFKEQLREMGLDPQSMKPVLTVRDVRRRIYVLKDGNPFMSISHDQASSSAWWARTEFCELEPELNEIGFTEASAETRAYMESVLHKIVGDIMTRFPRIERNLTPKYNKAFDAMEAGSLPFYRALVRAGMQDQDSMYMSIGLVVVVIGGVGAWIGKSLGRRKHAPAPRLSSSLSPARAPR